MNSVGGNKCVRGVVVCAARVAGLISDFRWGTSDVRGVLARPQRVA